MRGKIFSINTYIIMILLLLISLIASFSSPSMTNSPTLTDTSIAATSPSSSDNWQDSSSYRDTSWSGSGTSSSPYLITSAKELAGLAYQVNAGNKYSGKYFKQTVNIDLSAHYWIPIGEGPSICFAGVYDGNNNVVSGLFTESSSDYQGLFGFVKGQSTTNTSKILNVGIIDSRIKGENQVGAIAGYATYAEISHCYNTGSIVATGHYVGGIVGNNYYRSNVLNCFNMGTVEGNSNVGGVVGYNYSRYSTVTICYNLGDVSGNSYNIGGIVGGNYYFTSLTNCYNLGNVTGNSTYVGGIVGLLSSSIIQNCFNIGDVTSKDDYVGGIVGGFRTEFASYYISNCYNLGKVVGDSSVGGIIGVAENNNYISNCFNAGQVSGNNNIGGVIGWCNSNEYPIVNYYGGNCTLSYGVGNNVNVGVNSKISNIDSVLYAKNKNWYTIASNWAYPEAFVWDFNNVWEINSSINDGYPYLRVFNYSIIYDYSGGSSGSSSPSSAVINNAIRIYTPSAPTGYTFGGWTASGLNTSTARYGSNTSTTSSWTNGSTAVNSTYYKDLASVGGTVTLTAQWNPISYSIDYELNDGTWASDYSPPNNTDYDTEIEISNPTKEGYDFAGWTASNLSDTAMIGSSSSDVSTSWNGTIKTTNEYFKNLRSSSGTVTMTANWTGYPYQVKFDGNGATSGDMSSQSFIYGTEQSLTNNAFARIGHKFLGWSTSSTATSPTYTDGQSVSNLTTRKNEVVTLYAVWQANEYTLTFDANGGSVTPTSIKVTYGKTYGEHNNGVFPTPTRIGYLFMGWSTTQSGGNFSTDERFASSTYLIEGDSKLYARWYDTWYNHIERPTGAGTITNPYKISKSEHLGWLSYRVANGYDLAAYCEQTANIDMITDGTNNNVVEILWYPIGTPSRVFRGHYDGKGYMINYIMNGNISDNIQYQEYAGLFGYINGAEIDNVYVVGMGTSAKGYTGGIAGYAINSLISNCAVFLSEFISTNTLTCGAIVGYGLNTVRIENCSVFTATSRTGNLGLSGGQTIINNCVYILNGVKGYIGTSFSNFVYIQGMKIPVPKGLSWLAQGGTPAILSTVQNWKNS